MKAESLLPDDVKSFQCKLHRFKLIGQLQEQAVPQFHMTVNFEPIRIVTIDSVAMVT